MEEENQVVIIINERWSPSSSKTGDGTVICPAVRRSSRPEQAGRDEVFTIKSKLSRIGPAGQKPLPHLPLPPRPPRAHSHSCVW